MAWRVLAVLFLSTCGVLAQSNGGTITGTIIDPDKNVIAAAPVYAKHIPSGRVFKTDSSRAGTYTFSQLPAGAYEISVPSIGFTFRPYAKNDVAVQPRQTVRSDISLEWSANLGTVGDDTSPRPLRRFSKRRVWFLKSASGSSRIPPPRSTC